MSDYKDDLLEDLKNASYASHYISAAYADSPEAFLVALRDVADAQMGMKKLAVEAGVNRENLYRMLSEEGNPRLNSLRAVLDTLELDIEFKSRLTPSAPPSGPPHEQVSMPTMGTLRIEDFAKRGMGTLSYGVPLYSSSSLVAGSPGNTSIGMAAAPNSIIDISGPVYLEHLAVMGTTMTESGAYAEDLGSAPNINPELMRLLNA